MRAMLRLPRLAIVMGFTLVWVGCASHQSDWWWPQLSYELLSAFSTDAPNNDPLGKLESIKARAAGLDSTERFHRGL